MSRTLLTWLLITIIILGGTGVVSRPLPYSPFFTTLEPLLPITSETPVPFRFVFSPNPKFPITSVHGSVEIKRSLEFIGPATWSADFSVQAACTVLFSLRIPAGDSSALHLNLEWNSHRWAHNVTFVPDGDSIRMLMGDILDAAVWDTTAHLRVDSSRMRRFKEPDFSSPRSLPRQKDVVTPESGWQIDTALFEFSMEVEITHPWVLDSIRKMTDTLIPVNSGRSYRIRVDRSAYERIKALGIPTQRIFRTMPRDLPELIQDSVKR